MLQICISQAHRKPWAENPALEVRWVGDLRGSGQCMLDERNRRSTRAQGQEVGSARIVAGLWLRDLRIIFKRSTGGVAFVPAL